ncbi:MAG TPA: 6-phosphogluconolactonase [Allosphingosinicella sp.]|uniref:6-phosphogluconolactonase n=1 Tax=Allosphingosinicella sp. TaxID=2823234 RepID=UPI002ED9008F
MEEVEWWEFDTAAEMAEQAAGDICFVIESAIEAHGGARIAVPGGSTPDPVFRALLEKKVDWSKVTILPTDDRLVPLNDVLSHYCKLESLFGPEGANVVPLVDEGVLDNYREAGRLADERLKELQWPLDLVWLNIGLDGHTAGIFQGPDFDRAITGPRERMAVGVHPSPMPQEAPVDRVTLTAAAVSSARAVMLVVNGHGKREVLEEAIKEGPLSSKPIGRVLAEIDAAVDIFWNP